MRSVSVWLGVARRLSFVSFLVLGSLGMRVVTGLDAPVWHLSELLNGTLSIVSSY